MSLCKECAQRSMCTKLCPEAEAYVSQDWVALREVTIDPNILDYVQYIDIVDEEFNKVTSCFSQLRRRNQVETLLKLNIPRKKIAQLLGITRKNLRNIIYKINQKRPQNT